MKRVKRKLQILPNRKDPRKFGSAKEIKFKNIPDDYSFIHSLPRWIPVEGNFVRPGFKDAAHFMCERDEEGETGWTLVQGIVWMKKGRRINYFIHAWCEKGNLVVDRIRGIQTTKKQYYREHRIKDEWFCYGIDETRQLMADQRGYGPFSPDLKALLLNGAEAGITG